MTYRKRTRRRKRKSPSKTPIYGVWLVRRDAVEDIEREGCGASAQTMSLLTERLSQWIAAGR